MIPARRRYARFSSLAIPGSALIAVALFMLVARGDIRADEPPKGVTKYPGWRSYGAEKHRKVESLGEIPKKVRDRAITHLKARLGGFYARLTFTGGDAVDLAKDSLSNVPAFDLHFEFRMPEVGIESYTAYEISCHDVYRVG